MTLSIDWLTVYQDHNISRQFGAELVVKMTPEGEPISETVTGFVHPGSYSSKVKVRCSAGRVEVSGNPSKFGRRDNLFGYQTINECLEVYNGILRELGLPTFTGPDAVLWNARTDTYTPLGPRITRIDLCQNYAVGPDGLRPFFNWLSGQQRNGKPGNLYPGAEGVDWGGSRRIYIKYYDKAAELKKHLKPSKEMEDPETYAYVQRLARWCQEVGLVRYELSLKATQLKEKGLSEPTNWTPEKMEREMANYRVHDRVGQGDQAPNRTDFRQIAGDLMAQGYTERQALNMQRYLHTWLAGVDLREQMSKTTWYRVRAALRTLGIDIASRPGIDILPIKTRRVEIQKVQPPDWYEGVG